MDTGSVHTALDGQCTLLYRKHTWQLNVFSFSNCSPMTPLSPFPPIKRPGNQDMPVLVAAISAMLAFVALMYPEKAIAYCMKPSPPYKSWSFNSNQQIDAYNKKVDEYNRDIEQFRDCATRQIESYNRQYAEYLRCEARSYGSSFSSCFKPSPPRF